MSVIQEGPEPLPRWDHCGMHISAARLIKHRWTARCNKSTEMRIIQRDVDMVERCREMEFGLYGREGGALVEGVTTFNYLGLTLDQTDDDWSAVR